MGRRNLALTVLTIFGVMATAGTAGAALSIGSLPNLSNVSTAALPQDLMIYDRHGALIADLGNRGIHRTVIPLGSMPPSLIEATIAVEDRSFYRNSGIDLGAIARAALDDLTHLRFVEGGSTITQQLVKQFYFGANAPDSIQRKLREAVLAVQLTHRSTKNQILETYLNTIYYGSQAYGVEAAARTYFHESASQLSLGQAALLAGIPRSPSAFDPVAHPAAARLRQAVVLSAMVRERDITPSQAAAAASSSMTVYAPDYSIKAPYFVDYLLSTLRNRFHIAPGSDHGYRIVTSLDLGLQAKAEASVATQLARAGTYYNFHDAALVSLDPRTGEVLAMVGGAGASQINMATSPTRQVGSAFKIFTYSAAIESGKLNVESPILDAPLVFPIGGPGNAPYAPVNYDGRWHGIVSLKAALGNSLNIPALKAELITGIPQVLDVARRMGATSLTQPDSWYGPSLTLGAYPVSVLDMAVAASTLADAGIRHAASPILQITDMSGHSTYRDDPSQSVSQAISPQVAYIMGNVLSDDQNRCLEFGCKSILNVAGHQVAAKTGTSEGFRDNWTLGYTPTIATVTWVGNPDNTPLNHNSTGIVGAAPIWHQFMTEALQGVPDSWLSVPSGLDQAGNDDFLPGTEFVAPVLAQAWPACPNQNYDPKTTSWSSITMDGVPCAIVTGDTVPFT